MCCINLHFTYLLTYFSKLLSNLFFFYSQFFLIEDIPMANLNKKKLDREMTYSKKFCFNWTISLAESYRNSTQNLWQRTRDNTKNLFNIATLLPTCIWSGKINTSSNWTTKTHNAKTIKVMTHWPDFSGARNWHQI